MSSHERALVTIFAAALFVVVLGLIGLGVFENKPKDVPQRTATQTTEPTTTLPPIDTDALPDPKLGVWEEPSASPTPASPPRWPKGLNAQKLDKLYERLRNDEVVDLVRNGVTWTFRLNQSTNVIELHGWLPCGACDATSSVHSDRGTYGITTDGSDPWYKEDSAVDVKAPLTEEQLVGLRRDVSVALYEKAKK